MPFPAEKNFTDGELAIEQAIERGATRLVLIGSFGGARTDHALSHLLQAVTLAERGLDVVLTSGAEEAVPLLPGSRELDLPAGSLFSVVAFTALEGLSLSGAKYPLDEADIAFGASRTISNVAEGRLTASLNSGRALIIARPHDFSGA
jgi:thiamine pyrophosphokinase